MDEIRFAIDGCVEIFVNGRPLRELVREVELPYAEAEGTPDIAGSYAGLHPDRVRPAGTHFLGMPEETWFDDGDTALLGCECGVTGCWPLTADVRISGDTVVWQHFRQGHRDWDLSALGPFVFDRAQYEAALAAVAG